MPDPEFVHPPDPELPPPLAVDGGAVPSSATSATSTSGAGGAGGSGGSGGSFGAARPGSPNPRGRLADPSIPHEDRTYCLLMHASIVALHFLFVFSFVIPLVMWLARRDSSRFIDDHGRETLNFHLSIMLYTLIGLALIPLCGVGAGVLVGTYVLALLGGLMACLAAARAEYFRYPMCVRFVR